jgi:glycosyltransferase involved in cell wall biosynthesis
MFHPCYEFYSDAPTTAPRSSAAARLLFFGAIRPYKGLEVLIKALGLLHEHLDFEAVVAGEPYYDLTPSRDLAKRLGVAGRIRWLDRYIANEEVPALFSEADVVVLPYLDATQSGVVPVAYRYDVPVIASDVGGLAEVVIQEQTGFLVPPGDPQALAARILQYFQEGRKFGFQEQIRSSKGNLSWRQAIDKIFEVWELAQRRRSGLQQTPTEAEER